MPAGMLEYVKTRSWVWFKVGLDLSLEFKPEKGLIDSSDRRYNQKEACSGQGSEMANSLF